MDGQLQGSSHRTAERSRGREREREGSSDEEEQIVERFVQNRRCWSFLIGSAISYQNYRVGTEVEAGRSNHHLVDHSSHWGSGSDFTARWDFLIGPMYRVSAGAAVVCSGRPKKEAPFGGRWRNPPPSSVTSVRKKDIQ